jgi:hypothetical protein
MLYYKGAPGGQAGSTFVQKLVCSQVGILHQMSPTQESIVLTVKVVLLFRIR